MAHMLCQRPLCFRRASQQASGNQLLLPRTCNKAWPRKCALPPNTSVNFLSALDVRPVFVLVTNLAPVFYASLLRALSALVWVWKHMKIHYCALQHRKKTQVAMRVGANFVLQCCRIVMPAVCATSMFAKPMAGLVAPVAQSFVMNLMRTPGARFSARPSHTCLGCQ